MLDLRVKLFLLGDNGDALGRAKKKKRKKNIAFWLVESVFKKPCLCDEGYLPALSIEGEEPDKQGPQGKGSSVDRLIFRQPIPMAYCFGVSLSALVLITVFKSISWYFT